MLKLKQLLLGYGALLLGIAAVVYFGNKELASVHFMPHRMCYVNDWQVMTLEVASNLIIWASYMVMGLGMIWLARKRTDLAYRVLCFLFGGFIFACGMTHLLDVIVTWWPRYWTDGAIRAGTAIISSYTACKFLPIAKDLIAKHKQLTNGLDQASTELAGIHQTLPDDVAAVLMGRLQEVQRKINRLNEMVKGN